jgi:acetoin utilization deacetylase AcuC-like enzyme
MDRREFLRGLGAAAALGLAGCPKNGGGAGDTLRGGDALTPDARGSDLPPPKPGKTGLVYDPIYKQHVAPGGHPEQPARCEAIMTALTAAKLDAKLTRIPPRAATETELELCHDKSYVSTVKSDVAAGKTRLSTGDTYLCSKSYDVALQAAGGLFAALDAVVAGTVKNALCVVRPPGHHAGPNKGMGFCIFSNAALAARYAQTKHKLGKVAIVDWDVHHGNGTQDVFWDDGSVFFFDTHQHPLYPGTGLANEVGAGEGKGTTLNCPFPAGSGRSEILGALEQKFEKAMESFKPELVVVSSGFDSRKDDPLGSFTLTDQDFADMTDVVTRVARRHAQGRVVSTLEGGYNLNGIGLAAAAHVGRLLEG